eukprot:TRINITY_DN2194_c0_g3_i4.p2 TRINITY_DN2194_c0_g3~~TRINITY_DN2194_c0_g3_i4.p2  ORF type:complete len:200 (-),score=60.49 TRINITY_DN2194_c0_g3_i4:77-676(-)
MGGASIAWARNSLQLFNNYDEFNQMASGVKDSGDVYFVPGAPPFKPLAFSGLYAPHWRSDARGLFIGLTQHTTRAHLLRAIIDGMCFRVKEVLDAMQKDLKADLVALKVDGGVTINDFIMQTQANILEDAVERRTESEMTALGCALAAGMAKEVRLWDSLKSLRSHVTVDRRFIPQEDVSKYRKRWEEALQRSLNWVKK